MGDRIYGEIHIGGRLYRKDLEEFLELACEANRDDKVTEEWLLNCHGEVVFRDPEASYGEFEDLEIWCRHHDLTYRRESEGKYEYDPETVYWTPGLKDPIIVATNHSGNETITVKGLSNKLLELKKFLKKCNKVDKAPLHINAKNINHIQWAKHILSTNKIDPIELLELWVQTEYPDTSKIPAFEII
jgi:hypothetical protein